MRHNSDVYEYIRVYVDDLAIVARDPKTITTELETNYKFKLKGTGPISFHLSMGFFHDEDGVLCVGPNIRDETHLKLRILMRLETCL